MALTEQQLAEIPEDLRKEEVFQTMNGWGDVAKSLVETKKMVGSRIPLPREDLPPEERQKLMDEIHSKIGWPKTFEEYEIDHPANLPPEIQWNERYEKWFRENAHAARLTKGQAKHLSDEHLKFQLALAEEYEQEVKARREELKKKWGANYDYNVSLAEAVVENPEIGGPELMKVLGLTGALDQPLFMEFLAKIGTMLEEADYISGEGMGEDRIAEAKKEIDRIKADPKHPAWVARDPDHEKAVIELNKLYQVAYPGKAIQPGR
jgi:hypothetical protein